MIQKLLQIVGMECFMFDNFYDMIAVVILARMVDDVDKKVSFS